MHRKEVLADLSRVVRRATLGALAPSGVAGALRIERVPSHSNVESTCAHRRHGVGRIGKTGSLTRRRGRCITPLRPPWTGDTDRPGPLLIGAGWAALHP